VTTRRERISSTHLLENPRLAGLGLEVLAGRAGLAREVTNPRLQKPGLALAGFLASVKPGRVHVLGSSEAQFLATLPPAMAAQRIEALVALLPPLIVVSKGMRDTADLFVPMCERFEVPLALASVTTSVVIERLSSTLEFILAPREVYHGDLLDIFAIGVLLLGDSGSGKSECALELVHRGHRLVADDIVEVFRLRNEDLIGQAPEQIRGLMEVRGLGLISIEQLFGVVAVRDSKPIDLVIRLAAEDGSQVERLGLAESTIEILDVRRPVLTVPVAPGKSLALLIECAARKYLLTQRGVTDVAVEYLSRHDRELQGR
jgi:HPr kinase/phosphorylase